MSEATVPLRHPACTCALDMPEGTYSMDCGHHVAVYADAQATFLGTHAPLAPVLDVAAVQEILTRRAYRPGWTMAAYVGETTGLIHVEIDAMVEDSYNPGNQTRLHVVSPVPPYMLTSELDFDRWLAHRLIMVEVHESQEWYRKPGRDFPHVPVFNPHANGADRDRWPIAKRDS